MSWRGVRALCGRAWRLGIGFVPCALLAAEPPLPPPSMAGEPQASYQPLTNLTFDSEIQEFHAKAGDTVATFSFQVTNISDVAVHIIDISPSCHCTSAQLPRTPWVILPHTTETFHATMQLAGKPAGPNPKVLSIISTNGTKQLVVKSFIPDPAAMIMDRQKNQTLAQADRQAVFRNTDCAQCHATPTVGKTGRELYSTACGICHDSPSRAAAVPDLAALNHPVDAAFWRAIIEDGKTNSMMPAFGEKNGGPLPPWKVDSLVQYLVEEFPHDHKPVSTPAVAPAPMHELPRAVRPPPPPGTADNSQSVGRPTAQSLKPRAPANP